MTKEFVAFAQVMEHTGCILTTPARPSSDPLPVDEPGTWQWADTAATGGGTLHGLRQSLRTYVLEPAGTWAGDIDDGCHDADERDMAEQQGSPAMARLPLPIGSPGTGAPLRQLA